MKRKIKSKGKTSLNKLNSKRNIKVKPHSRRDNILRKQTTKGHKRATAPTRTTTKNIKIERSNDSKKIVRIMGHGQFTVDVWTLRKLNDIDHALVEIVSRERSDDSEFKQRLAELNDMVIKNGKPLDPHGIIKSDIILPSADLSIDEAKKLFSGEGVIPVI